MCIVYVMHRALSSKPPKNLGRPSKRHSRNRHEHLSFVTPNKASEPRALDRHEYLPFSAAAAFGPGATPSGPVR